MTMVCMIHIARNAKSLKMSSKHIQIYINWHMQAVRSIQMLSYLKYFVFLFFHFIWDFCWLKLTIILTHSRNLNRCLYIWIIVCNSQTYYKKIHRKFVRAHITVYTVHTIFLISCSSISSETEMKKNKIKAVFNSFSFFFPPNNIPMWNRVDRFV